jgi:hypothetical protein
MMIFRKFGIWLAILTLVMVFPTILEAQINLYGNNYLEYAYDTDLDTTYFEDWADINFSYKNWRMGVRYEFHLPPQAFSQDSVGQGISQRFLEYKKEDLTVTLGNFYSLFGRGLVLRSFENRMLRWDTNIDGVKFDYYHEKLDFQILGGRPRDRRGRRREVLQGGVLNLKPLRLLNLGGSFVTTRLESKGKVNWGSVFGGLNFDWGSFYGERAFKDFPAPDNEGKALYLTGNVYFGQFTVLVEYKDYDHFDLTEPTVNKDPSSELTYNNPPAVFREHLYTLMNRHQLVQNADEEEGYLVELTYSLLDETVITLSHSQTKNHEGLVLYREYYGQVDWDPQYNLNFVGGVGEQKDPGARYLNFVGTGRWGFSDYNTFNVMLEHQHVKRLFNDRQFYNQLLTLSYDRSPRFTLSFIGEHSTDQESEKDIWLGGQVDLHFLENFDLTIFGGSRRKGKVCVGGICVLRPEFEGVEIRLINRF